MPGFAAALSSIILCLNEQIIRWSSSGLETTLVTCLVFIAVLETVSQRYSRMWVPACIWMLAVLCRPDAVVLFGATASALLFEENGRKRIVKVVVIFLIPATCYLIWRKLYFGLWFPATFHTRVGYSWDQIIRGSIFLKDYLSHYGVMLAGMLSLPLWFKPGKLLLRVSGFAVILQYFYVVVVGGDWMAFRFFSVTTPFELILFAYVAQMLCTHHADSMFRLLLFRSLGVFLIAWSIYTNITLLPPSFFSTFRPSLVLDHRTNRSTLGELIGGYVEEHHLEHEILVTPYAEISYYSEIFTINPYGLTTRDIALSAVETMGETLVAHEKENWAFGIRQKPLFICPDYKLDEYVTKVEDAPAGIFEYIFPEFVSPHYLALRIPTTDNKFTQFTVRRDISEHFVFWLNHNINRFPARKQ